MGSGERYGRWTMLGDRQGTKILCRCDCGTERFVNLGNLRQGISKSCGCLRNEKSSKRLRSHETGYEDYRYRVWQTIKAKCLRPTFMDYPYYGGRGIKMHEVWQDDFVSFRDYLNTELGPRPDGYTLDRINNSGHYEPGNLRWASRRQQALNRRSRWRNREAE